MPLFLFAGVAFVAVLAFFRAGPFLQKGKAKDHSPDLVQCLVCRYNLVIFHAKENLDSIVFGDVSTFWVNGNW